MIKNLKFIALAILMPAAFSLHASENVVSFKNQELYKLNSEIAKNITYVADDEIDGYLVIINGNFPLHTARPFQLYVGDYLVREYGGTANGLYFKLKEPDLINKLDNQAFKYVWLTEKPIASQLLFSNKLSK